MHSNNRTKRDAYAALVAAVRNSYPAHTVSYPTQPLCLEWCEDCQEINLWSYWQGRGHLDARIMLVGQDWGSPWDVNAESVMKNIRAINAGRQVPYMHGNENITDRNLICLFREIGYDICSENANNAELFFTNLVLGYRNSGISGGFKTSWAKKDAPYFAQLSSLIEPEIILCLGRATFEGVLGAFNYQISLKTFNYNRFITSEQNPVVLTLENGKVVRIFALAHCGALGTLNRNRGVSLQPGDTPLSPQIEDWKKIIR